MGHAQAMGSSLVDARGISGDASAGGLRRVLGEPAWLRLPWAVRERFGEPARAVDYAGVLEVVRASRVGRVLAWIGQLLGTPVVPRTGQNIRALVRVGPSRRGVDWTREYRWPDAAACRVRSTKVITPQGALVEELPAHLCMALEVHEECGVLHFVSRGYYFELRVPMKREPIRLPLPGWLSPGTVHVEHEDEAAGWFRFTMTVTHPLLGELFYQTGRFHAQGDLLCPWHSC
jgi:hypothetical protein